MKKECTHPAVSGIPSAFQKLSSGKTFAFQNLTQHGQTFQRGIPIISLPGPWLWLCFSPWPFLLVSVPQSRSGSSGSGSSWRRPKSTSVAGSVCVCAETIDQLERGANIYFEFRGSWITIKAKQLEAGVNGNQICAPCPRTWALCS